MEIQDQSCMISAMHIDVNGVKKLSLLARLEVTDEEVNKLVNELGSILEYVGQINSALTDEEIEIFYPVKNARRADEVTTKRGEFTTDLLALAPQSQDGYVKVKKII